MMTPETKSPAMRYRRWFTPAIVAVIALLLVLSLGLAGLVNSHSLWLDLTPEQLYTLSDAMIEQCDQISADLTVTFCNDPDRLMNNYETRYVYVMAKELEQRYDNISVKTYNVSLNPTSVDRFRVVSTSTISPTTVIVSCGERYRMYDASQFWIAGSDEDGNEDGIYSFNGEYKMATAFLSLAAIEQPKAYFTINHGEKYYVASDDTENASLRSGAGQSEELASFYQLLQKAGLKVGYVDLTETGKVPDDCSLLIINNPATDLAGGDMNSFYEKTEVEMLDRFLSSGNGGIMIMKDPSLTLTNLEEFAVRFGISFVDGSTVKQKTVGGSVSDEIRAVYSSNTDSPSYSVYETLASIDSSPAVYHPNSGAVSAVFSDEQTSLSGNLAGGLDYSDFLLAPSGSALYAISDDSLVSDSTQTYAVSGLTTRVWKDPTTSEQYCSYLFCSASASVIENEALENSAFGNADVFFSLVRYIARSDEYADLALGSESFNSENMGGKKLTNQLLSSTAYTDSATGKDCDAFKNSDYGLIAILVFLPVLASVAVGAFFCLKRRSL